ncbi:COP9 signalosome subunit CSN8 [Penicillium hispanicum]|uniref:COP9 signalosome subunit CSN8 n=1 Tax=Penicillium hispanicum TaxID=1080232 RepID=UPI002540912E|nr:COP9 signalosome subunit CSN8 [Penicillium hispanicum]KAJ5577844.1 COP9 signalosome subunit CSN8 [Penicillium hispanicum]
MELPPFSIDQLSKLVAANVPSSQLFEILSQYEMDACLMSPGNGKSETEIGDSQLLSLFYSIFFFAHLLTKQIPEARALTKRMPEALRHQDPSLQNCLTLLRAVWQTNHAKVYEILRGISWLEALKPLVQRYESFFQNEAMVAVSTSYEAIRPATAATYVGLDPRAAAQGDSTIVQRFTDCGWRWDSETQLLYPAPIPVPTTDKPISNGIREAMAMLGSRGSRET